MRRFILMLLGIGLLSLPALAANNSSCWGTADFQAIQKKGVSPLYCIRLLDDIATASGGPSTFNLATLSTTPLFSTGVASAGFPDLISFEVGTENCAAGTITITTSEVVGGPENTLPGAPTLDLAGASNSVTRINVNLQASPLGSVINTRWSGASAGGCAFDVLMVGYEVKR